MINAQARRIPGAYHRQIARLRASLVARICRYLVWRTLTCELWIARVGLLFLAAYSSFDFALPIETFKAAPKPYKIMSHIPEERWAVFFGILAVLTVLTLLSEARATRGPWCQVTWQVHGLTWMGIGLSFVLSSPASWTSWMLMGIGLLAELVLFQPLIIRKLDRREVRRNG